MAAPPKINLTLEQAADAQHIIWSHWMRYQFSKCEPREDGSLVIPADLVERWKRQMDTAYCDLSEDEKESDRKIVYRFLAC